MAHIDPIPALKRQAADALVALLDGWPAWEAAVLIGTDQPRISDLRRGKLERFSLETLIRYLVSRRRRVELQIIEEEPPHRAAVRGRALPTRP